MPAATWMTSRTTTNLGDRVAFDCLVMIEAADASGRCEGVLSPIIDTPCGER
jgi:hypothetical protein